MNVLFLSKEYPPETGWGGIGTYVYNIAHALSERGDSVHILSLAYKTHPEYKEQKIGKGSIHIHRINPIRFPTPILNRFFFRSLEIIKYNLSIILKIKKLLNSEKFDIIEAPEWRSEAFLLSFIKPKGVPLVIKCHSPSVLLNEVYKNPPTLDSRCVDWIERAAIRNANLVISPSKSLADIVSEKMGIKREGIRIIPNPIDTETFSPVLSPLAPCPLPLAPLKVLFVGRLDRLKGTHIFAEAIPFILKVVPDVSITLIGRDTNTGQNNSSMKSFLESLIPEKIRDKVIFTGNIERGRLVDYYRESAICVAPSLYENFPNTVLEAMSCGKAVVASNTGGIPEVIEDGISGLLVKTGDAKDLAEKVIMLLKKRDMRENIGINARKRIESLYSKAAVAKNVEEVYAEICRLTAKK
ncbi:MAG: glycosyltransferase family 4 protein [Nitrospinae bacterium]|nr:glycosyltransferase family 4 protein [Nitrospinota bacterium]